MPARTYIWLIVVVILCAGLTIFVTHALGLSVAWLGLIFAALAVFMRLWIRRT